MVLGVLAEEDLRHCPNSLRLSGADQWAVMLPSAASDGAAEVSTQDAAAVVPSLGSRAYFATECASSDSYDPSGYMRAKLLGRTLKFTADLRGASCGCNAMLYLTAMGHSAKPSSKCPDHYCDANGGCGESCAEIDIMEANQYAWHSTLHRSTDESGATAGYGGGGPGWNGARDWSQGEYGPTGSRISTSMPFDVAASFPVDEGGKLVAMQVSLSQESEQGRTHSLLAYVDYSSAGLEELTQALSVGMTPIVSYWGDESLEWLDGKGQDGKGPCKKGPRLKCSESVRLSNFSIEDGAKVHRPPGHKKKSREDFAWLMNSPGLGGAGGWVTSPYSRAEGPEEWVSNLTDEVDPSLTTTRPLNWLNKLLAAEDASPEIVTHFEIFGKRIQATDGGASWMLASTAGALLSLAALALATGIRRARTASSFDTRHPERAAAGGGSPQSPGAESAQSLLQLEAESIP